MPPSTPPRLASGSGSATSPTTLIRPAELPAHLAAGKPAVAPSECGWLLVLGVGSATTLPNIPADTLAIVESPGRIIDTFRRAAADPLSPQISALSTPARRLILRLTPGPAAFRAPAAVPPEAIAGSLGLPPAGAAAPLALTATTYPPLLTALTLAQRAGELALLGVVLAPAADAADAQDAARAVLEKLNAAPSISGLAVLDSDEGHPQHAKQPGAFQRDPGKELAAPAAQRGPTIIRLLDRGWRIERNGVYEERFIAKQARISILFVCTGNTCRSPMAEAFAADLARRAHDADPNVVVSVVSAGTGAGNGQPTTPEAVTALRELGVAPPNHGSRPLTRRMIAEADVVYAMSRSHLAAVLELDPEAGDKATTLDPRGGDIPDPIGSGQSTYSHTAKRIRDLVELRFKELLS